MNRARTLCLLGLFSSALLGVVPTGAQDRTPDPSPAEPTEVPAPEAGSAPTSSDSEPAWAPAPLEAGYAGSAAPYVPPPPAPPAPAPPPPPPHIWTKVEILGQVQAMPREYYLIPQVVCDQIAGAAPHGCIGFILRHAAEYGYGPSAVDGERRLRTGDNYYAVPVCSSPPRWEHRSVISVSGTAGVVRLRCPQ